MAAVGGSIQEISIKGRIFPVAADADSGRSLGGFTSELKPNGSGGARIIQSRVLWSLDGLTVEIDHARGDQEFLQDNADGQEFVDVTVTYADGITYQGTGKVTGEIKASSQDATCPITLGGPQKLTQQ